MDLRYLFRTLLGPEQGFYWLAVLYGIAMSILTLAVPLSVQILINSIANTALARPLTVLGLALLGLLLLYGLMFSMQTWVMDRFERRFFARVTQEIVLRSLHARFSAVESVNREELANRFFEIVTVQRNLPTLMIGGSALLLQSLVGFVVVSAYHPMFIAFNAVLILLLWIMWTVWNRRATESKIKASKAKFRVAGWLEELARANAYFKSERSQLFAADRTEMLITSYLGAHRRHFRHKFSQLLFCLALYAGASAGLLVIGGWLVIDSALTLGQLVAAELILSVIFLAIARLPDYLDLWYELCAAVEKLGDFYRVPLEGPVTGERVPAAPGPLVLRRVAARFREQQLSFDFSLAPGDQVMVVTSSHRLQKNLTDLLLRHVAPEAGTISFAGANLADLNVHGLRDAIALVDHAWALEASIADNLALGDPTISRTTMREMLGRVALGEVIDQLPDGLDTLLGPLGHPLSRSETIRLRIAAALLARPRVLILTEVFDTLSMRHRRAILEGISAERGLILLDFSTRRDIDGYGRYLLVEPERQRFFPDLASLVAAEAALGKTTTGSAT